MEMRWGGILVAAEEFRQSLQVLGRTLGMNLGPFEAYLTMTRSQDASLANRKSSVKTLRSWPSGSRPIRASSGRIFPGDPSHPDREITNRLFERGQGGEELYGGLVSFEVAGAGKADVFRPDGSPETGGPAQPAWVMFIP